MRISRLDLKNHIKRTSIVDHKKNVLKMKTLKDTHAYCVLNKLSAQQYGPLIENYICAKNKFKKNKSSLCNGDCSTNAEKNIEIKVSLGGVKNNKFNYVQLRPSHNIQNYILTAYHLTAKNTNNLGDLYIFNISKENMIDLIFKFGRYAHGTKKKHGEISMSDLRDKSNDKEYALRTTFGDHLWESMLKFSLKSEKILL